MEGVLRHGPPVRRQCSRYADPPYGFVRDDTAYKATVELPGVAQDQVNIEVRDNMLIVEGEKKNETEDKDEKKGYYRMERSYGSFRRVLSLPEDVETDKITATHKDGVLSIEIPRKEPEKPAARKIEVVKGE